MRTEINRKVAVIDEQNGRAFERAFNEKMKELSRYKVNIERGITKDYLVYIYYEIEEKVPESAKEEFKLRGELYQCGDCPFIKYGEWRDHSCPRSKKIHTDTPACSYFYEALKEGRIEVE